MSEDARNSIYLWTGGIAFAVFFWLALKFQLSSYVPHWIIEAWQVIVPLVLIFRFGTWLWRRRKYQSEVNG